MKQDCSLSKRRLLGRVAGGAAVMVGMAVSAPAALQAQDDGVGIPGLDKDAVCTMLREQLQMGQINMGGGDGAAPAPRADTSAARAKKAGNADSGNAASGQGVLRIGAVANGQADTASVKKPAAKKKDAPAASSGQVIRLQASGDGSGGLVLGGSGQLVAGDNTPAKPAAKDSTAKPTGVVAGADSNAGASNGATTITCSIN